MKTCCQSGSCIKPHYDWSEVGADKPLEGLEWVAVAATILAATFAGTTVYLMVQLHNATGRYF